MVNIQRFLVRDMLKMWNENSKNMSTFIVAVFEISGLSCSTNEKKENLFSELKLKCIKTEFFNHDLIYYLVVVS